MKFGILLLLVGFIAVASAGWTETHNGRPACKTALEVSQGVWRNNFDPTAYFVCTTIGVDAEWRRCRGQEMFDSRPGILKCVPYDQWEWIPNEDPPSLAEI